MLSKFKLDVLAKREEKGGSQPLKCVCRCQLWSGRAKKNSRPGKTERSSRKKQELGQCAVLQQKAAGGYHWNKNDDRQARLTVQPQSTFQKKKSPEPDPKNTFQAEWVEAKWRRVEDIWISSPWVKVWMSACVCVCVTHLHITSCVSRTRHISGFLFCPSYAMGWEGGNEEATRRIQFRSVEIRLKTLNSFEKNLRGGKVYQPVLWRSRWVARKDPAPYEHLGDRTTQKLVILGTRGKESTYVHFFYVCW